MDFEDLMPCGDCSVCGEMVDHTEAGFCESCGQPFHWARCGEWGEAGHECAACAPEETGED